MAVNGRLTTGSLMLVQDTDLYLARGTGWAWLRFKAAAKSNLGRSISIAKKAGAYRSFGSQQTMRDAFVTRNRAIMTAWNMDFGSTVAPAEPGSSPHGLGIAVDIVNTAIDAPLITLAHRYGFTFPFPKGDPRHAVHDQRTGISPIPRPIDHKKVAAYLNGRKLGKQTDTDKSGTPDRDYVWLLQTAGHKDGVYPTPPFVRDGKWGPKTRWLDRHYDGKVK